MIGFIFILLFTVRGIYSVIFTIANHSDFGELLSGALAGNRTGHSPGYGFNNILRVLSYLILIHSAIGVYYVLKTDLNITKMFREKVFFYLQILSSFAVVLVVIVFMVSKRQTPISLQLSWALNILIAVLSGYHFGKGFLNACITLGVSVSQRSISVVRVLSWIVAFLSMVQIFILFI